MIETFEKDPQAARLEYVREVAGAYEKGKTKKEKAPTKKKKKVRKTTNSRQSAEKAYKE